MSLVLCAGCRGGGRPSIDDPAAECFACKAYARIASWNAQILSEQAVTPPLIDPTGAYKGLFPEDSAERKTFPVYSGLLQYFPSACAAVAHHSFVSNDKHNPGQPMHHDRSKSGDEADALVRHVMEGDYVGAAWRALSLLQKDLEAKGAPIAPAARNAGVGFNVVFPEVLAVSPGFPLSKDEE